MKGIQVKNNFLAIVCMTLWLSVAVHGQDTHDIVTLDYAYTVEANGSVSDVFWCPDESCFAVVSKHLRDSDSLLIFDTGTGDLLQTFSLEEELAPLDSLKFNHDTSLLLGTLSDINSVKLWKISSGEAVSVINPDDTEVAHSYFNPFAAQVIILVRNLWIDENRDK